MAKADKEVKAPQKSNEETYNEHNHESAQAGGAEKQCQCKACKAHRGDKKDAD